jgi:hypothetical protein
LWRSGLPSAEVEIADFGGKRVLVIERFDRRWTRDGRLLRLPQEDRCPALSVPPSRKYEADGGPGISAVLNLLNGSDDPTTDRLGVRRRWSCSGCSFGHPGNSISQPLQSNSRCDDARKREKVVPTSPASGERPAQCRKS